MAAEIACLDFILISRIGQQGVFDPHAFQAPLCFSARLWVWIVRQPDHNGIGWRANLRQRTDCYPARRLIGRVNSYALQGVECRQGCRPKFPQDVRCPGSAGSPRPIQKRRESRDASSAITSQQGNSVITYLRIAVSERVLDCGQTFKTDVLQGLDRRPARGGVCGVRRHTLQGAERRQRLPSKLAQSGRCFSGIGFRTVV